jgi:uncharacterized membrane protein
MLETIDRHAPADPMQRLGLAVVAAVFGVLAVGDATNFITFPVYQLGLPDTALANFLVFLLGAALLVVTYRLVELSVGDTAPDVGGVPTTDGAGQYDDRDPEHILKNRYARGELTDEQFERMRSQLGDYDMSDDQEAEHARDFAENHELDDRQTLID